MHDVQLSYLKGVSHEQIGGTLFSHPENIMQDIVVNKFSSRQNCCYSGIFKAIQDNREKVVL